jgi:hypothetical protein
VEEQMPPTSVNSLFEIIALVLYAAGPVAAFVIATRTGRRTRFQLILAAALGGLVSGVLAMGLVVLQSPGEPITIDHIKTYLIFTAVYVETGILIGLAGVVARKIGRRDMVMGAFTLYGGYSLLVTVAAHFTHRRMDSSVRGVVLTPSGTPAAHAAVYFDRDHGITVRFTTDSVGRFRIPIEQGEIRDVRLLICASGTRPMVGRGTEGQIDESTFKLAALDPGERVNVRGVGWHGPIPRECPAEEAYWWSYPPEGGKSEGAVSIVEPAWESVVSSVISEGTANTPAVSR